MSKFNDSWELFLLWVSKKIRSPFSNFATKFTLMVGSAIVATPLVEHLIFDAIFGVLFGFNLGIDVPDTEAYIFGSLVIFLSLLHNILYIKLTNSYDIKIKDNERSVYKKLWVHLDDALDDTARLTNLYCKVYDESFNGLVLKAENSVIECASFLRKNRPFFFSEDLYEKCSSLNDDCFREIKSYRACLQAQKYEQGVMSNYVKKDVHLQRSLENYDFYEAKKCSVAIIRGLQGEYNGVCEKIKKHVTSM